MGFIESRSWKILTFQRTPWLLLKTKGNEENVECLYSLGNSSQRPLLSYLLTMYVIIKLAWVTPLAIAPIGAARRTKFTDRNQHMKAKDTLSYAVHTVPLYHSWGIFNLTFVAHTKPCKMFCQWNVFNVQQQAACGMFSKAVQEQFEYSYPCNDL